MTLRKLDKDGINQLIELMEVFEHWTEYRDYVFKFYGPKSHRAVFTTYEHYDDENYEFRVENVIVFDIDGKPVDFDLSPYTEDITEKKEWCRKYGHDFDINELIDDVAYDDRRELPVPHQTVCEFEVIVGKSPVFPKVYIEESE